MADNLKLTDVFPLLKITDTSDVLRQFLLRIIELSGLNNKLTVPLELVPPVRIEVQTDKLEGLLEDILFSIAEQEKKLTTQAKQITELLELTNRGN